MKLNKKYIFFSFFILTLVTLFIPSEFFTEGKGQYKFGAPFSFITIYQDQPQSMWLSSNLFNGNAGININPALFIFNVIIIYVIIFYIIKIREKRQTDMSTLN